MTCCIGPEEVFHFEKESILHQVLVRIVRSEVYERNLFLKFRLTHIISRTDNNRCMVRTQEETHTQLAYEDLI